TIERSTYKARLQESDRPLCGGIGGAGWTHLLQPMQFPSGSEWTYSLLGNGLQPERKAALGSACNASQPFAPVEHVPIDLNRKVSKGVELSESMRIDHACRSGPH